MKTFIGTVSCVCRVIVIRFQVSNPASLTQILHQVVSNKMVKSVLVSVARWKVFPKYKLRKRWTKKFMVSCSLATSLQHAAVCCAPSFCVILTLDRSCIRVVSAAGA